MFQKILPINFVFFNHKIRRSFLVSGINWPEVKLALNNKRVINIVLVFLDQSIYSSH